MRVCGLSHGQTVMEKSSYSSFGQTKQQALISHRANCPAPPTAPLYADPAQFG